MFWAATLQGATLYVAAGNPGAAAPYGNWATAADQIQTAVNAAASGDEILVGAGVYPLTAPVSVARTKRLTLRATHSRAAVIDAQGLGRALEVRGTNSLVEGFLIRNGVANDYGGCAWIQNGARLVDCEVVGGRAYGGAGVCIYETATVEGCVISNNLAQGYGGGLIFYSGLAGVASNCTISGNVATNEGGGVYVQYGGTIAACRISDNRVIDATGDGGGVSLASQGTAVGGAIFNSLIVGNTAPGDGGGVYCQGAVGGLSPIVNCTIADNTAGRYGGGVRAMDARLINSIFYYNTASDGPNYYLTGTANLLDSCCLTPSPSPVLPCFTDEPAFVDRAARDYRLATGSPCIDRGTATGAPGADLDGNPRPLAGTPGGTARPDVGAFEHVYRVAWDAGFADIGGGWRRLAWFGDYIPMGSEGWIWHNRHGFFYVAGDATPASLWLYAPDMGWLWTGNASYPFLYRHNDGAWLWYNGAVNPRWFRNMTTGQWESRP